MVESRYKIQKRYAERMREIKRLNDEVQYLRQLVDEKNTRNAELMAELKAATIIGKSGLKTETYQQNNKTTIDN